jgi:hypothetical protein
MVHGVEGEEEADDEGVLFLEQGHDLTLLLGAGAHLHAVEGGFVHDLKGRERGIEGGREGGFRGERDGRIGPPQDGKRSAEPDLLEGPRGDSMMRRGGNRKRGTLTAYSFPVSIFRAK